MTLAEYLDGLPDPAELLALEESRDLNLELLLERLEGGAEPVLARILEGPQSPLGDRCILFIVHSPELDRREHLLVCPGPRTLDLIRGRLGGVTLSVASARPQAVASDARAGGLLPAELKAVTQRAVVCDLCSTLPDKEPACVAQCPHKAAFRVDARFEFPTR